MPAYETRAPVLATRAGLGDAAPCDARPWRAGRIDSDEPAGGRHHPEGHVDEDCRGHARGPAWLQADAAATQLRRADPAHCRSEREPDEPPGADRASAGHRYESHLARRDSQ